VTWLSARRPGSAAGLGWGRGHRVQQVARVDLGLAALHQAVVSLRVDREDRPDRVVPADRQEAEEADAAPQVRSAAASDRKNISVEQRAALFSSCETGII